eukprot:CAMPEP_0117559340 /NCGR_PEP_ID=MMETSP0784-20121206/53309_1 /TAXON_ID=39447 /ORGANISM="" /LENGTH=141 /DNA_ID=CAMNT_0005356713 /DNA_START=65 /DNA_END=490 /DNA_ORIENTATION=-
MKRDMDHRDAHEEPSDAQAVPHLVDSLQASNEKVEDAAAHVVVHKRCVLQDCRPDLRKTFARAVDDADHEREDRLEDVQAIVERVGQDAEDIQQIDEAHKEQQKTADETDHVQAARIRHHENANLCRPLSDHVASEVHRVL